MNNNKNNIGYLVLQTGDTFEGEWIGFKKEIIFECVFNTSMFGYTEILSDPSYFSQGIVFSYPMLGNYGINTDDMESQNVWVSAMFCHELCDKPSNFRNQISLNDFLIKNKIPGLQGVNTRAVVSILRDNGVIKAKLTSNISNINDTINEIKNYKPKNPLDFVTVKKSTTINPKGKYIIALYDFGVKQNIVRELVKRNCKVIIFPPESTYEDMMKIKPNGFVISNGPCDPKDNVFQIKQIKKIYDADIPMLGICLGHQMIALSVGFNTIKLPYGHRAVNHPCKYINGHTYLTTQNHGYNVDESSINSKIATVSFTNLNDKTIEGLIYKNKKYIETTQFHPEASSGPLDTGFIFDNFINAIRKEMK